MLLQLNYNHTNNNIYGTQNAPMILLHTFVQYNDILIYTALLCDGMDHGLPEPCSAMCTDGAVFLNLNPFTMGFIFSESFTMAKKRTL